MPAAADAMFARITESMIRKRAEHNEGMLSNLEEVALHQQNIGRIEALGRLCPHLKILYLQNNLIGKLENLHKLKELEYLNMAVNNVTRIQNLQRCESLQKLDLTINFVDLPGLLTISSLQGLVNLKELTLMGNPCAEWSGYRAYVIAKLPQLKKLDSVDVKRSERIAAQQVLAELEAQLQAQLRAQGVDPDAVLSQVEDDSIFDAEGQVQETGTVDEATGEMRRPWCPATRVLDHLENERMNREAEARKTAGSATNSALADAEPAPTRRTDFPEIKDGERVMQRNEGRWDFSMEESDKRDAVVLEVEVGKYLDTSLIKADVQPSYIRLLIKGKLLQLLLPCEVRPDASSAQRSQASGRLVVTMPKEDPQAEPNIALIRPRQPTSTSHASPHITATSTTRVAHAAHDHAEAEGGMRGSQDGTSASTHASLHELQQGSRPGLVAPHGMHSRTDNGSGAGAESAVAQRKAQAARQAAVVKGVLNNYKGAGPGQLLKEVHKAVVVAVTHDGQDDDDAVPDL